MSLKVIRVHLLPTARMTSRRQGNRNFPREKSRHGSRNRENFDKCGADVLKEESKAGLDVTLTLLDLDGNCGAGGR
ncbi:hypothetical protein GE061_009837 [Apolygus lucorum]|uniref:Uncharacterized protein n=1 Tax=Apolygus lucorum TaxID=248454 RepID=A0A8S9Y3E2_APOLU|nr:hypothetical protein GE061_009837 [Apolygus lucorum]